MKTTVDLVEKIVNNFSNLVVNEIETKYPDCDDRNKGYLETKSFIDMVSLQKIFNVKEEDEDMSIVFQNMSFVFDFLKSASKVMDLTVDDVLAIMNYTEQQIYLSYMFLVVLSEGDTSKVNDKMIAKACAMANAIDIEDIKSFVGCEKDQEMDTFMFNPVAYLSIIPFDRDFDYNKVKAVLSEDEPVEIVTMHLNIDGETENVDEDGDSKVIISAVDYNDDTQRIFCIATVNGKPFDISKMNIKFKVLEFNEEE